MKKLLLAGVALTGLLTAGAASAADLPSRRVAPAAPAPVIAAIPVFTWTGFYAGVNAGYGWGTNNNDSVFIPGVGYTDFDNNDDGGFVGGGQIGYNLQLGSFVVGVETDLQFADIGGGNGHGFHNGVHHGNGGGLDYFGTVRARLGVAIDRALVYATGGFAYGGGDNGGCYAGTAFVGCGDDTSNGYTLGGGVEFAVTNNLTVKVEGLYVNLDRGGNDAYIQTGTNNQNDLEFGVVRAGLNFKF
jgi:outer membrane immunogenic protein